MTAVQYDGPITIAVGQSRRSTQWQNRDLLWSQLVNRLEIPERTQESAKEYKALPKAQRDEIKDVGGFVGGVLKGGRRKADAITQRRLLTLDLDEVPADADPWDTVVLVLGCAAVLYSTHSHRPDAPRLRLVKVGPAALSRMFGVSEAYCGDYLKKQLGITFQGRTTRQETLRFLNAYRPDRGPVCADKKNTELTRVSLTFCGGFSPEAIAARLQGLFPTGAAVSVTVDISAVEA